MNYQRYVEESVKNFVPAKMKWNYEDGCVLLGAAYLYEVTGQTLYKEFILNYLNDFISPEGEIRGFSLEEYNIDSIHTGRLLFYANTWVPEDKRYRLAMDAIRRQLDSHPRLEAGNFWHKKIYPYQVWLDGLFMGQPFYAQYDTLYGGMAHYRDIVEQFKNVRKFMYVEDKKLYIHCYDEKREQPWANKESGHSPNFWLRAIGWYLVSLVETYEQLSETIFEAKEALVPILREALDGVVDYMDPETGLLYDLVDLPEQEGNYLETSGSAMVALTMLKAVRLGMVDADRYLPLARKMMQSLHDLRLEEADGHLCLTRMCEVSGLGPGEKRDGSVAYYLSEPIVADDHKGMGAFMMAWAELLRLGDDTVA